MSKVNHRGNGKKYRHEFTYFTNGKKWSRFGERRCGIEVLYKGGVLIPECDIKFARKIHRRKVRHQFRAMVLLIED